MKKFYAISYFCLAFVTTFANAKNYMALNVYNNDEIEEHTPHHRVPIPSIRLVQDGFTLIFPSRYSGDIIEVIDGETLLYTSYILENGIIEIPSNISGNVEIRLLSGNRVYSGTIDL